MCISMKGLLPVAVLAETMLCVLSMRQETVRLACLMCLISIRWADTGGVRGCQVEILAAEGDGYAAAVDDALLVRLGPGRFDPGGAWAPAEAGKQWQVWERSR